MNYHQYYPSVFAMRMLLFVLSHWIFYITVCNTQDSDTVRLLKLSEDASIGTNVTLICTWETTRNVTRVKWFYETTFIIFITSICDVATQDNNIHLEYSINTGYRYQLLTFINISREMNGTEWNCANDAGANLTTINVVEKRSITLSALSPVTWYGSSLTFVCSYDLEPGISQSSWYLNDKLQFTVGESCIPSGTRYTTTCTSLQHVVTLANVTSGGDGGLWHCSVGSKTSNNVQLTVLSDPGWQDDVQLYTTQTEEPITAQFITLICSTRCEDDHYDFHWNIPLANSSDITYNSCASICEQNVTVEVDPSYNLFVNCTVVNARTRKTNSATVTLNEERPTRTTTATSQPLSADSMEIYIAIGSAVGGVVILCIIIIVVVVVMCKRKAKTTFSDKVMVDNVLYTSAGSQSVEKPVMEENVLYEVGGETDILRTTSFQQ